MKNFFVTLLAFFYLTSCSGIGTTRVKNIIDFTPKLEVESPKNHLFFTGIDSPFKEEKSKLYKSSKNQIIGQPAIAKGVIYSVDYKGYVSAFSLKDKKMLWMQDIAGDEVDRNFSSGGVLFSDDKLYITHGTRNLVILDAANGYEIIRKEFPDILRSKPVMLDDSLIIVQTVSNQLLAYNIKASRIIWMHEGGSEIISSESQIHPVINNGNVLVSYSSGEVYYLNAKNGSVLWAYNLSDTQDVGLPSFDPSVIVTKPIFIGNYVYFATSNGKVAKLDIRDGVETWVKMADDIQSMVFHDNNLIITNNARQVAVLSSDNGKTRWIGNLISKKERESKRPKTARFLDPFVVKDGDNFNINVISSNGELYQFTTDESGELPQEPKILSIDNHINYYWISCCNGALHLILPKQVRF